MKQTRWLGVVAAAVFATGGIMSVAAAPLVSAGPALASRSMAPHVHGVTSGNWSGYADTQQATAYTFVEANWTEPSYTCDGGSPESSAVWVGLDGYFGSNTVEQGGTIAICSGHSQGTHMAWWEMYPKNAVQEVFAVKVGDKMFASVTYTAGTKKGYDILVKDLTSGKSLNKLEACSTSVCVRASAEWIVESPDFGGTTAFLPKFNPIVFTGGSASESPGGASPTSVNSFPNVAITMTGSHDNRAVPSALTSGGTAFSDKWLSSS